MKKDKIIRKIPILKMVSNKINSNQKNRDQI
jgi:hypothetical protein